MKKFVSSIRNFLADETGATAIEYGLMVGLIAAVIVVIVTKLGVSVQGMFQRVCLALGGNASSCSVT